ncbi:hypothetical protein PRIC2_006372 [Phytophthora ramorum]
MDMATGEALLTRLWGLFQQDPLIDEVGLLFGVEQNDLTPDSAFFLEDHKLGVAFAAGTPLFQAARTQFHVLNALLQREALEMTRGEVNERRSQLLHCTRAVLLVSADFYTAWNARKAFVARGWLDARDEVQFTNLVFTLHPKSIDTWAYRRWLAIRLCESLTGDDLRGFYQQQIEVCSRLAELKPRNYHAWSFRHWIVSRSPLDLALKELDQMEQWCRTHVTDHSGWNHRQHTLNELLKRYHEPGEAVNAPQELILAEYRLVSDIMASYPTHEALWCHRRYVVKLLLGVVLQSTVTNASGSVRELVSQVSGTLSIVKSESIEAPALHACWGETLKTLPTMEWLPVFRALLLEIDTAWKCGNQFSRRYAAWCLARLRVFLQQGVRDEVLVSDLNTLSSSLQKHLVQEDSVLEDLWLRM